MGANFESRPALVDVQAIAAVPLERPGSSPVFHFYHRSVIGTFRLGGGCPYLEKLDLHPLAHDRRTVR